MTEVPVLLPPALSMLTACLGLLPAELSAQQPGKPETAACETATQVAGPWAVARGLQLVGPKERGFVEQLDAAWSSGNPSNVLALFSFLHPQAGKALGARVMMTSSGRRMLRKSRILAAREEQKHDGRLIGLWLGADLERVRRGRQGAGQETPKLGDDEELFELLVLHEAKDGTLRGRLLLQTTRDWQLHVQAREQAREDRSAEALGRDQLFRCQVCNYEVGSPRMGNWVVLARPSFLSACIEAVDVFSLDEDLAMEVSVHPHPAQTHEELRHWLEQCRDLLAAGLGQGKSEHGPIVESELGGSRGWKSTVELTLENGPARHIELHATQHGDATYLFAIQAAPGLLAARPAKARELLETFRLLDPKRPVTESKLLEVFGGPGAFSANGSTYELEQLGIRVPGFADWKTERRIGLGAFNACWLEESTGSTLRIVGVERPTGAWSTRAVVRYLAQLVERNRGHLSPRPGFKVLSKLMRVEIAGKEAFTLDFEYRVPGSDEAARCSGFVHAIPLGRFLLLVAGESMPGPRQAACLEEMRSKVGSIQLR